MKKLIFFFLIIFSIFIFFLINKALSISLAPQIIKPKIPKPRPHLGIQIKGIVSTPNGARVQGVKIKLYECLNGSVRYVKAVETKKNGSYLVTLGLKYLHKRVKLVPQHKGLREGEGFSVQYHTIEIMKIDIPNHNFLYTASLPDLRCANVLGPKEEVYCAVIRVVPNGVYIDVSVANWGESRPFPDTGPFRVLLDGKFGDKNQIIVEFPSGIKGSRRAICVDKTIEIFLPNLKAEDVDINYVALDIDNSVTESEEYNNLIYGPFLKVVF